MARVEAISTMSRRSVLQAAVGGAGVSIVGQQVFASQIDVATPDATGGGSVVPIEPLPIGVTVASKAAELGYDVEKMFRFVADEVAYEPYAGALRGANGTLWSLAGNSVDKSILFAALLDEALVEYRFAFGSLDESGIRMVTDALRPDRETLTEQLSRSQVVAFSPTPGETADLEGVSADSLTEAELQLLDDLRTASVEAMDRANLLSEQQSVVIADALAAAEIDLPEPTFAIPDLEFSRHTWVQVSDGPSWTDYAPAIAGAASGIAPTTSVLETAAQVPDDLVHTVTIRIVAEEFVGGTTMRRDTISAPFASADLVNQPIALLVVPPDSVSGIGYSLSSLFNGQITYVPAILANDIGHFADFPLLFGGEGDSAIDVLGANPIEGVSMVDGEALAMWLVVDIASPGADLVTVERVLFDRIGDTARLSEVIDFTTIEPVTMVTDSEGQNYVAGLTSVYQISIDSAYVPLAYAARDQNRIDMFGDLVKASSGMQALRDALRIGLEVSQGSLSFIASPQVTLVTGSKVDPNDLTSALVVDIDLMHRASTVVPFEESASGTNPVVLAGVMHQVAEQLTVEEAGRNATQLAEVEFGINVGSLFSAAIDQEIEIVAVRSADEVAGLDLAPEARERVRRAVDAGLIVVVPESPVDIGGMLRSGWWLIDPLTGQTRDKLDSGKGSASFHLIPGAQTRNSPVTEETYVIRLGTTASQYYKILGFKLACYGALFVAGVGMGVALSTGNVGAAGGAVIAAGGAAIGGC